MRVKSGLLPHQLSAVEKLLPIRVGAAFMEMGTGKSLTAIQLASLRLEKIWNVVWFCPVSLKHTVAGEILKHTDATEEDICIWNGTTDTRNVPDVTWHVVGIESMSASRRVILTARKVIGEFSMVIVDESSYIKGHNAERTWWITHLSKKARYRLILTGTPLSQGVVDLYAQMRFLHPQILGYSSFYSFAHNHLEYSDKYHGMIVRAHNTEWLAAKIQPYVYQVTKEECLDLPKKLRESRYFRLSEEQLEYYAMAKNEILSEEMDDFDSVTIFRLFTALQQIACGFWNRRIYRGRYDFMTFFHQRIQTLLDVIGHIPDGEKVIIWAKYQQDIKKISAALAEQFGAGSVALFHGGLSEKSRNSEVERFKREARFFLATPSCGGHGLTLNESRFVVFYNNGFKYSERLQAEDRNHRIGQERPVTYIDIVARCGIDERIQDALFTKGNVVQEFKRQVDKVKGKKAKIEALVRSL